MLDMRLIPSTNEIRALRQNFQPSEQGRDGFSWKLATLRGRAKHAPSIIAASSLLAHRGILRRVSHISGDPNP